MRPTLVTLALFAASCATPKTQTQPNPLTCGLGNCPGALIGCTFSGDCRATLACNRKCSKIFKSGAGEQTCHLLCQVEEGRDSTCYRKVVQCFADHRCLPRAKAGKDGICPVTDANRKDAVFSDPDGDNKPGVTVKIRVNRWISGEVYLGRREIFENHLMLMHDGSIRGTVTDRSEQLTAGASSSLFDSNANPKQASNPGLNPVLLIPIPDTLTDCDALMKRSADVFPAVPEFTAP